MKRRLIPLGFLERFGNAVDEMRYWSVHSWRIGSLMVKGAYHTNERRRLFQRLGEGVFYKMVKGEMTNSDLEPMVRDLEKVNKKIEIEEILVRSLRFGERRVRRPAAVEKGGPS